MTTETHAILYQSADGTLSLGMKCKTPECAAESVPLFEGAHVLGTVALLPEPVSGMSYRLAAQPPKAEVGQEVGAVADPVGVLTVRRWRGIDAMVNHEFEYLGDLADGTYSLFTSPATPTAAADSRDGAAFYAACQRACAELPRGWIVNVCLEEDAGTVDLVDPEGNTTTMDVDADDRLTAEVNAAIDAARNQEAQG